MRSFQRIATALANGKAENVKKLVEDALERKISPAEILEQALIVGMNRISDKYHNQGVFVPDVLLASRAFHAGMRTLQPFLLEDVKTLPNKVVIGTVAGDLHDIGKNLVVTFLRAKGYEVIDLGIDVRPEEFVEAVVDHKAKVLGMSALLTTTMPVMNDTIQLLQEKSLRDKIKVIVGGGPITREYGSKIGADGYAAEAKSAIGLVDRCFQELS